MTSEDVLKTLLFGTKRKRKVEDTKRELEILDSEPGKKSAHVHSKADDRPKGADYGDIQFFTPHSAPRPQKKKVKSKASKAQLQLEQARRDRKAHRIFVWGTDVPAPALAFSAMSLPPPLLTNLAKLGLAQPTPVQMQTAPAMIKGREVICSAPTGSGKTLAFALPLLAALGPSPKDLPPLKPRAAILAPTRELATQIYFETLRIEEGLGTRVHLLVKLKKLQPSTRLDVVVTTPKRLLGFLRSSVKARLDLSQLHWLVVDESDKLFQEGNSASEQSGSFREQLAQIHATAAGSPHLRRAFFSATFAQEVEDWAKTYLDNPISISIGQRNTCVETVAQEFVFTGTEGGKLTAMRSLVANGLEPPVLLFVQSKDRAEQLALELGGFVPSQRIAYLHGSVADHKRDEIVSGFRETRIWFLVCTELMGRGVDFKNVSVVVNWDCPLSRSAYIHQAGVKLPAFMDNVKAPSWQKKQKLKKNKKVGKAPARPLISKDDKFQKKKPRHKKKSKPDV